MPDVRPDAHRVAPISQIRPVRWPDAG
jgi:hypothetical protein